jgi:hypothetical protein
MMKELKAVVKGDIGQSNLGAVTNMQLIEGMTE